MNQQYDIVVIGGGAAGFFFAIQCKEKNPAVRILILEKSNKLLAKVKISGGGRCNVTHGCFDPREMVQHYPRGHKELLGPFHRFLCGDMMGWLSDHGVETKIEDDGRVFPVSNKSQTIIDCFLNLCEQYDIDIRLKEGVNNIEQHKDYWQVTTTGNTYHANKIFIATGSSPASWKMISSSLGHSIVNPVPSLFTFNIDDELIKDFPGLSVPLAHIKIVNTKFEAQGPLLITHWGLSGPGILKLSAWAARELHACDYNFQIVVNWISESADEIVDKIKSIKQNDGKRKLIGQSLFQIPKRLWSKMVQQINISDKNYASLTTKEISQLAQIICQCPFHVTGKSTFKDEFVTCGGIDTKEISFKTMESKLCSGIYFGGEVINIDAVTGGFNFQAAWTAAYIAAEAVMNELLP